MALRSGGLGPPVVRAVVGSLLVLGACTTSSPSRTAPTTALETTTSAVFGGSTAVVSVPSSGPVAHLSGVRVEATRVTFSFDDVLPGYRVAYVARPVTQDASGAEVQVAGDSVLSVRMEAATGVRVRGEKVEPSYRGPRRVAGSAGGAVVEAVATGDYEAVLNWAIGVRGHPAFRVTLGEAPPRLVVELAQG